MNYNFFKFLKTNKLLLAITAGVFISILIVTFILIFKLSDAGSNKKDIASPQVLQLSEERSMEIEKMEFNSMPVFSPNGEIAIIIDKTTLFMYTANSLELREQVDLPYEYANITANPASPTYGFLDDTTIFYTSGTNVILYNITTQLITEKENVLVDTTTGTVPVANNFCATDELTAMQYLSYTKPSQDTLTSEQDVSSAKGYSSSPYITKINNKQGKSSSFSDKQGVIAFPCSDTIAIARGISTAVQQQQGETPAAISLIDKDTLQMDMVIDIQKDLENAEAGDHNLITAGGNDKNIFFLTAVSVAGQSNYIYHSYNLKTKQIISMPILYTPLSYNNGAHFTITSNGDLIISAISDLMPNTNYILRFCISSQELEYLYSYPLEQEHLPAQATLSSNGKILLFAQSNTTGKRIQVRKNINGNTSLPDFQSNLNKNYLSSMPFPRGTRKVDVTFTSDLNAKFYTVNNFSSSSLVYENNESSTIIYTTDSGRVLYQPVVNKQADAVAFFSVSAQQGNAAYMGQLQILTRNEDLSWSTKAQFPDESGKFAAFSCEDLSQSDYLWDPTGRYLAVNFTNYSTFIYDSVSNTFFDLHNKQNGIFECAFSPSGKLLAFLEQEDDGSISLQSISTSKLRNASKKIAVLPGLSATNKITQPLNMVWIGENQVFLCATTEDVAFEPVIVNLDTLSVEPVPYSLFGGIVSPDGNWLLVAQRQAWLENLQDTSAEQKKIPTYLYNLQTQEIKSLETQGSEFVFSGDSKAFLTKNILIKGRYEAYSLDGKLLVQADIPAHYGGPPALLPEGQIFANIPQQQSQPQITTEEKLLQGNIQ